MKLEDYFKQVGAKPTPWAKSKGISASVISRFLNGKGISVTNALKIQLATGGEVLAEEVLGIKPERLAANGE